MSATFSLRKVPMTQISMVIAVSPLINIVSHIWPMASNAILSKLTNYERSIAKIFRGIRTILKNTIIHSLA